MAKIVLREDFIKLGQALKAAKLVGSGVEAKIVILDGKVKVNGQVELQRGKKLYDKDVVSFAGETIEIVKDGSVSAEFPPASGPSFLWVWQREAYIRLKDFGKSGFLPRPYPGRRGGWCGCPGQSDLKVLRRRDRPESAGRSF